MTKDLVDEGPVVLVELDLNCAESDADDFSSSSSKCAASDSTIRADSSLRVMIVPSS